MTTELKKEYTRRITQANKTGLIVILYDIALTYLSDAKAAEKDLADFELQLDYAGKCMEEMISNLHFLYAPARELQAIYLSMKKTIRQAKLSGDRELLDSVIDNLKILRAVYEKITDQDTSEPVMAHTQTVISGLTYGKNSLSENLADGGSNRGFRV